MPDRAIDGFIQGFALPWIDAEELAEWTSKLAPHAKDFQRARSLLDQCRAAPDTFALSPLYDLYQQRLDEFAVSPPSPDWDGVFNMEKH